MCCTVQLTHLSATNTLSRKIYWGIINLINAFTSWWYQVRPSRESSNLTFNSARIFIDSLEDYVNQEIAAIDARNPNDSSISSFS